MPRRMSGPNSTLATCRRTIEIENALAGVSAVAHDDHTGDGFTFAVEFSDAAPHVRAELNVGDLSKEDRHALVSDTHSNFAQVLQILDVAAHLQHELFFREFDGASAHFAV